VEFIKIGLSWALLKTKLLHYSLLLQKEFFNQFYIPSRATILLSLSSIEIRCNLKTNYTAVLDLIFATIAINFLSLPVVILTLGCIWLARLFEKVSV